MRGLDDIEMPHCRADYLLRLIFEIGPVTYYGADASAISHAEITAWMGNSGVRLSSWESRTLRKLSGEYLSEYASASDPDRPAPWQEASYAKSAATIKAERARDSIRALASI
jgi:hypothetical protein